MGRIRPFKAPSRWESGFLESGMSKEGIKDLPVVLIICVPIDLNRGSFPP